MWIDPSMSPVKLHKAAHVLEDLLYQQYSQYATVDYFKN